MRKKMVISSNDKETLSLVGRALSSPIRIDILHLLSHNSYNIAEISETLNIPPSSTAVHIQTLEEAQLIYTELQPGERGTMKLCSNRHDALEIILNSPNQEKTQRNQISMPVGAFTGAQVNATCGMLSEKENIIPADHPQLFFDPNRLKAQLIWTASGFLEYTFPYPIPSHETIKSITLILELCSEAPNYREDWPSDITFSLNEIDIGTWKSPGDFGARQGLYTPSWWSGSTQYGQLISISVFETGTFLAGQKCSEVTIDQLGLVANEKITVRIGNRPDAKHIGGFNLFGKGFGDYDQDILFIADY